MSRRLAQYRAIARTRVPVDVTVQVTCPICEDDTAVTCYVSYGIVETVECVRGCHRRYSDSSRALVEQAAKDAAESERNEIQNREPDDER